MMKTKVITRDYPSFIQIENYINNLRNEDGKRIFINKEIIYAILQYMKYIIEKNNFNISNIINGDIKELFIILRSDLQDFILSGPILDKIEKYKIYECLKYIAFESYTCLALNNRVLNEHIEKDKKYLYFTNFAVDYIIQPNVDVYDRYSNLRTTRKSQLELLYYLYDSINDIKRNIVKSTDNLRIDEYDEYIFINGKREFVDCIDYFIDNNIKYPNKIFAVYEYQQISKYKGRHYNLLLNIESIVIDMNKSYLQYNRRVNDKLDKSIYIKDITSLSNDEIKDILFSNKEVDNISVKVLPDDIINHNYRIGLSTYINKDNKSSLVDLVDRSESITRLIHLLDEKISYKIDDYVVR